jgi:hypothetical protein
VVFTGLLLGGAACYDFSVGEGHTLV